jgi:hypothetical protein
MDLICDVALVDGHPGCHRADERILGLARSRQPTHRRPGPGPCRVAVPPAIDRVGAAVGFQRLPGLDGG